MTIHKRSELKYAGMLIAQVLRFQKPIIVDASFFPFVDQPDTVLGDAMPGKSHGIFKG